MAEPPASIIPLPGGRHAARNIALAAAVLIGVSLVFTAGTLVDRRLRALETQQREIDNLALMLAGHTERVFETCELVVRTTIEEIGGNPPLGGKPRQAVDAVLKARISGIPAIRGLTVAAKDGTIAASSFSWLKGNVEQWPSFRFMRDSAGDGLYVWRLSHHPAGAFIPVARRLTGPDGDFAGVINISLEPEYFRSLYRAVALEPGEQVLLTRDDGAVFASLPEGLTPPPSSLGEMVLPLRDHAPAAKLERGRRAAPEGARRYARAFLSRYPLYVEVRADEQAALASWRVQTAVIGSTVLAFAVLASLLVWRVYREINHRERAERERAAQSRLLQAVFDTVPHHIWMKDRQGRIAHANRALLAYLGMPLERIQGQRIVGGEFRPPEENARILEEDRRVLEEGAGVENTHWYAAPDGSRRHFHVVKRPLRDAAGAITGLAAVAMDITAHSRAEEALYHSQTLLKAVFDAIPLALLVKDLEGRLLMVNAQTAERWGLTPEQMAGLNVKAMEIPADEMRVVEETDARVVRENRILDYELKRTMPDGRVRLLRAIKAPLHGPDGRVTGILGISEDITERRRMEEDKVALERQLQQVQKMDTVGRLAGGVAHDFNNLLNPVIGFVDLALERLGPDDPLRQELGMIREAAARAAELTRGLLSFSRSQVMALCPVNLNEEVRALHRMLSRVIGEGIEIVLNLDPALGVVEADATQMQQVLMNLAVNARDAMPRGGKLEIETRNLDLDAGYAERALQMEPGPYVMVSVSDTGVGMSAETQARIFEPFFTTKEPGKGTGLGLSIVYGIVRQHRGAIRVYSEPGRGTSFKVLLPRLAAGAAPAEARRRPLSELGGRERVLVVEDEARVREAVCALLASLGYDVVQAASPGDALDLLENGKRGDPHLLLTDIKLPGQSGGALYAALRQRVPGLRVLYMSGYPRGLLAEAGAIAGPGRFIGKPFGLAELAEKVREVLEAPAAP